MSCVQDVDHAYYMSKIYSPGDAARKELWVNITELQREKARLHGFLSNIHRQAEVYESCWVHKD